MARAFSASMRSVIFDDAGAALDVFSVAGSVKRRDTLRFTSVSGGPRAPPWRDPRRSSGCGDGVELLAVSMSPRSKRWAIFLRLVEGVGSTSFCCTWRRYRSWACERARRVAARVQGATGSSTGRAGPPGAWPTRTMDPATTTKDGPARKPGHRAGRRDGAGMARPLPARRRSIASREAPAGKTTIEGAGRQGASVAPAWGPSPCHQRAEDEAASPSGRPRDPEMDGGLGAVRLWAASEEDVPDAPGGRAIRSRAFLDGPGRGPGAGGEDGRVRVVLLVLAGDNAGPGRGSRSMPVVPRP